LNFEQFGDEGEIWFGKESVEKMRDWALDHVPIASQPFMLEVGAGNGTLLFSLADAGYDPRLMAGIDYSPDAVRLAQSIAEMRGSDGIAFYVLDFLQEEPRKIGDIASNDWDLILDKGTFDAMALATKDEDGKSPSDGYPARIARVIKPGGRFLITSCNFTEEELRQKFATSETGLVYQSRIQHPTFTFGGKTGSSCSSVAFQKPTR